MVFYVGLFVAAVGGIHQRHIELVRLGVVQHIPHQSVVVVHPGDIQSVKQQVGDAKHIGELFFLNAVDGIAVGFFGFRGVDLLVQLFQPADQKATGAAGKIRHLLADFRLDDLGHKVGDGPGGVKLTGGTGALQFLQDGFVNLSEGVALLIVAEIQLVDHVDDLAQQDAVFHVVVGVGKGALDDGLFDGGAGIYLDAFHQQGAAGVPDILALQDGEERIVDKVQQPVTGHGGAGFIIVGPVLPAAFLRENGLIVFVVPLPVLFLCVVHFQKQHPRNLLNALGIAVDARVIAHNIPQPFYKSR